MNSTLQMLTREEVAKLLHTNKDSITMLREIGILKAIKTGRNYMFSEQEIFKFQENYAGLDVSNYYKAKESYEIVKKRIDHKQSIQSNFR